MLSSDWRYSASDYLSILSAEEERRQSQDNISHLTYFVEVSILDLLVTSQPDACSTDKLSASTPEIQSLRAARGIWSFSATAVYTRLGG